MGVGKYSPTVSTWYARDQKWFYKNGGNCAVVVPDDRGAFHIVDYALYDKDGYDSYGYNDAGRDRAGYTEDDYLLGQDYDDDGDVITSLWDDVCSDWYRPVPAKPAGRVWCDTATNDWFMMKDGF